MRVVLLLAEEQDSESLAAIVPLMYPTNMQQELFKQQPAMVDKKRPFVETCFPTCSFSREVRV